MPSETSAPQSIEVPALKEAATPCEKLLLVRAAKVQADDPESFGSIYHAVGDDDLDEFITGLTRLAKGYADWLKPLDQATLAETLAAFADMLQVSCPSDMGIELMLEAMADFPANLMPIARLKVARSHKYARLPYPKDFIDAVAGELAWCEGQIKWVQTMRDRFIRARNLRATSRRMTP